MKVRKRLILPFLTIVGIVIAGCDAPSIAADARTPCPLGQRSDGGECRDYTKMSEMHGFAQQIIDSIAVFAISQGVTPPSKSSLRFITPGDGQTAPCAPMPGQAANSACFYNGDFYIGGGMLFNNYSTNGSLAPITIIAHEYGHDLQESAGMDDSDFTPGEAATVNQENQADCVSGAYVKWLGTKQAVTLAELHALLGMIWVHGSNPYMEPYKIHGTATERTNAFTTGYDNGLTACNDVGNEPIA